MLALRGCVQPALAPSINAAAARVLDRIGISLARSARRRLLRRGALPPERPGSRARRHARADRRLVAAGRARRSRSDRDDRERLRRHGEGVRPPARARRGVPRQGGAHLRADARPERGRSPLDALPPGASRGRVAFHSPCTLQHGQQIRGKVEALLTRVGYELAPVRDAHLCCGSAGTYSLLQPGDRRRAARAQARRAARRARRRRSPPPTSAAWRICRSRPRRRCGTGSS